jgi:cupin fold WbuC family metalloprotein
MIKITSALVDEISHKAKASARRRSMYKFHPSLRDPIHRMLNAMEPGTYVQPHKHDNPDKVEVFLILRGKALAVEYDDRGKTIDHLILDKERGCLGVEFPPRTWHSFIALKEGTVLYEVKTGPYVKETDKKFAPWAPKEGAKEGGEFVRKILRELRIRIPRARSTKAQNDMREEMSCT